MTVTTDYRVTGMTCAHCAAAVDEELAAIGADAVEVALVPGGTSTVTVTSDVPLDVEAVAAAVDEAGYALAGPRDLPLA